MKKITSLFLVVVMFLSLCGCSKKVYKQLEFKHSDIYGKSVMFAIPDEWSYIEVLDTNEKSLFNLLDSENEVIGVGKTDPKDVSADTPLVSIIERKDDDEVIQINNDVICAFGENRVPADPRLIYVRVDGELLIISFDTDVDKKTIKNIAKSITFKAIDKVRQDITNDEDKYTPPENLGTVNLSILESAEAIDKAHSLKVIKAIYNTLDRLNPVLDREWIGDTVGFSTAYTYAYFELNCSDGYHYRFVENYSTGNFELWKSVNKDRFSAEQTFDLIYKKPLPSDCNVVTTHRDYTVKKAPYDVITIEQVEKIIETSDISKLYKTEIQISSYETSRSNNYFKTEFYVPEALAYFHIIEDYSTKQAYYGFSAIGEHHEYIPSKFNKYNVSKELSQDASLEKLNKKGIHIFE